MANNPLTTNPGDAGRLPGAPVPDKQTLLQQVMDSLEVMQLLHICRGTLYNWRKKGLIAFSKVGGRIYFDTTDVHRMLQDRKQTKWTPAA